MCEANYQIISRRVGENLSLLLSQRLRLRIQKRLQLLVWFLKS